jgi:hypothetical protein
VGAQEFGRRLGEARMVFHQQYPRAS